MKGGLMIFKIVRGLVSKFISSLDEDELPVDVKEGHFVVFTVDDGSLRRCVVELSWLTHPGFLKLLELAEKEFGFEQEGILVIPCTYNQLQSVIATK